VTSLFIQLIIDGAWFKKKENCLVVYGDPDLEYVSWWRYSTGERVFEIVEDLRKLKEAGRFVTQRPRLDAGKEPFQPLPLTDLREGLAVSNNTAGNTEDYPRSGVRGI